MWAHFSFSCKPTYEGLKVHPAWLRGSIVQGCKPTYEGLKASYVISPRVSPSGLQAYL